MNKWRVYMTYIHDIPIFSVGRRTYQDCCGNSALAPIEYADNGTFKDKDDALAYRDKLNKEMADELQKLE